MVNVRGFRYNAFTPCIREEVTPEVYDICLDVINSFELILCLLLFAVQRDVSGALRVEGVFFSKVVRALM